MRGEQNRDSFTAVTGSVSEVGGRVQDHARSKHGLHVTPSLCAPFTKVNRAGLQRTPKRWPSPHGRDSRRPALGCGRPHGHCCWSQGFDLVPGPPSHCSQWLAPLVCRKILPVLKSRWNDQEEQKEDAVTSIRNERGNLPGAPTASKRIGRGSF